MPESHTQSRFGRLLRLDTLPRNRAARITPSPASFDGTLDEIARRYVLPNLPLPDAMEQFHRQLVAYCHEPSALFLVRRAGETDNAPSWAVHYALFHEVDLRGGSFARFIDGLPTHMFEVARVMDASINSAGWHVAHIYDVGDRDTDFRQWTRANLAANRRSHHPSPSRL